MVMSSQFLLQANILGLLESSWGVTNWDQLAPRVTLVLLLKPNPLVNPIKMATKPHWVPRGLTLRRPSGQIYVLRCPIITLNSCGIHCNGSWNGDPAGLGTSWDKLVSFGHGHARPRSKVVSKIWVERGEAREYLVEGSTLDEQWVPTSSFNSWQGHASLRSSTHWSTYQQLLNFTQYNNLELWDLQMGSLWVWIQ